MKCPVCEKELVSMVCGCGYDGSRDYEKYPTFGRLPGGVVSVSGLRDRMNNLVRCGGCGGFAFTLSRKTGALACERCGRALTEGELKPLTDALGMKKAEPKPEKKAEVRADEKTNAARLSEFGDLLNVLKQQAAKQEEPKKTEPKRNDTKRIVTIAAGNEHTVALYADGTVAAVGSNGYKQCDVSSWRDITAIAAGWNHTFGLKKDGTVMMAGNSYADQKEAKKWEGITAITTGTFHTVGLKRDGSLVANGDKRKKKCDVTDWKNIQAISAGYDHTLGLDINGNVLVAGKGPGTKLPWSGWKNIQAIAAGYDHSAALTRDGKVLIVGDGGNAAELGASNLEVGAGWHFTVVRKKDGTAAATGVKLYERCDVDAWTDLEKIAVGDHHVVGLKKDGTLVAVGDNKKGQCNVDKLVRK